jgi:hypothetical protein
MENGKLVGNGPVRGSVVETAGEYDVSDNFGFMLQQRVGGCVDMTSLWWRNWALGFIEGVGTRAEERERETDEEEKWVGSDKFKRASEQAGLLCVGWLPFVFTQEIFFNVKERAAMV